MYHSYRYVIVIVALYRRYRSIVLSLMVSMHQYHVALYYRHCTVVISTIFTFSLKLGKLLTKINAQYCLVLSVFVF